MIVSIITYIYIYIYIYRERERETERDTAQPGTFKHTCADTNTHRHVYAQSSRTCQRTPPTRARTWRTGVRSRTLFSPLL